METFFSAQGLTPPSGIARYVDSAIAEWESTTGYYPFLGSQEELVWMFDGCPLGTSRLDLRGGFWEIASVTIDISYDGTGTLFIENRDYILLPQNAANENRGWNAIQFLSRSPVGFRCVEIVGKRGYAEELPDDVWSAIIERAAAGAMLEAIQGSGVERKVQQGPVTVEFDTDSANSKIGIWNSNFDKTVFRYMRI